MKTRLLTLGTILAACIAGAQEVPLPFDIRVVALPGEPGKWPAMAFAGPHGDYDARTGEILEEFSKRSGMPVVIAYGSRKSGSGVWIDSNRPLQRLPKANGKRRGDREWTTDAERVYHEYREKLLAAPGDTRLPEGPPIGIYVDYHGHNLKAKAEDGTSIKRNVFECVGRGFTMDEVRELKAALDAAVHAELGDKAPPTKWINLPEDVRYEVEGIEVPLTYIALESRVVGTLSSDVALRSIHIETPNGLRYSRETREKIPAILERFATFLRDDLGPRTLARNRLPMPDFPPARGVGEWTLFPGGTCRVSKNEQGDLKTAHLDPFEITRTETSNSEFASFLQEAFDRKAITVDGEFVNGSDVVYASLWPFAPLSNIAFEDGRFFVRPGRENHPVMEVSWHGADAYAKWAGGRLPTQEEWEAAAVVAPESRVLADAAVPGGVSLEMPATFMHGSAAPTTGPFPWTSPVGAHAPAASPIGCYDMAGNAWEWTADWYESSQADPGFAPTMKTIRGGGWDTELKTMAPGERIYAAPHATLPNVGFRIVRKPSPSP